MFGLCLNWRFKIIDGSVGVWEIKFWTSDAHLRAISLQVFVGPIAMNKMA